MLTASTYPRRRVLQALQGVKEAVKFTNLGLENYLKEPRERLLAAARSMDIDLIEAIRKTTIAAKKEKQGEEQFLAGKKMMHGQFLRQTKAVGNQDRWQWFRNGALKRETESLTFASQGQAIRTNVIKGKIDKSQEQTKCRKCSRADETINHIVCECPKFAQREYKRRHDLIGKHIHQEICRANGIHVKSK